MSNSNHERLLKQLQDEVNLVLEQSGRLFAAAVNNEKNVPIAQVSKLKQVLQKSDSRFHEALDQLDVELQTAKLVMRRDLALCREASGLPKLTENVEPSTNMATREPEEVTEPQVEDPESSHDFKIEDTVMEEAKPTSVAQIATNQDALLADNPGASEDLTEKIRAVPEVSDAITETTEKPPEGHLQIDTQTQSANERIPGEQTNEEDIPPDTATFSTTNDLDSLFGGPLSAGPVEAPNFDLEAKTNDDFDFDAFASSLDNNAVDNQNISTLLPGLEDYANTQPDGNGEPDFDALFATNLDGQGEVGQADVTHRDSTFDDLGDLLDFNVGEFAQGTGEDGSNITQDFDFSMQ